jgi:hypothetical protein
MLLPNFFWIVRRNCRSFNEEKRYQPVRAQLDGGKVALWKILSVAGAKFPSEIYRFRRLWETKTTRAGVER